MAIREGAWDCPHCGTERNRGPEKVLRRMRCSQGRRCEILSS